jgi:hypothetical protein
MQRSDQLDSRLGGSSPSASFFVNQAIAPCPPWEWRRFALTFVCHCHAGLARDESRTPVLKRAKDPANLRAAGGDRCTAKPRENDTATIHKID